jgi:hypothetical protein
MGLSDFHSSIGRASQTLPNVDADFEQACLWVLTEAFKLMRREKPYDLEWKETRFSAHLIGYMQKIRDREDLGLRIDPEGYLYRKEILEGLEDPDTAPRIDIKISGGWVYEDIYYGIEGKILVEKNWRTRREYDLRARYIDTGIDNFVRGRYSPGVSRGCVVGYVVYGSAPKIAFKINDLLIYRERKSECLTSHHVINGCPDCYQSAHTRTTDKKRIGLYHIHLTFC